MLNINAALITNTVSLAIPELPRSFLAFIKLQLPRMTLVLIRRSKLLPDCGLNEQSVV
jgi:hypothetical protein